MNDNPACLYAGTSPHTYGSEEVSLGDNQVQVRAKCLDQMGDTAVEVFYISK